MAASRNWCFTLNADEDKGEHLSWPLSEANPVAHWVDDTRILYMICQVERVAHVHVQGYIQFKTPVRLTGLKKINSAAHWEVRRGTHAEARDYCKKDDSRIAGPWEWGTEKDEQGKRNDLEEIGAMVKDHKDYIQESAS